MELPGGYPNERSIRAIFFLNFCEVGNNHSNGTHTGVEAAAARHDSGDVLRISGCFNLVYDAAARGHDNPSHCADATVKDAMTGAFGVWLGHEK